MSKNPNSPISEANLMAYIYDDVDDADIFGFTSANSFNNEAESKNDDSTENQKVIQSEVLKENSLLKDQVKQLAAEKALLEVRVSELYRTAKAEIERKDRRIVEVTDQMNNIIFKRNRNFGSSQNNAPCPSQLQERSPNYTNCKKDDHLENKSKQTDQLPNKFEVVKSEDNSTHNECSKEKDRKVGSVSSHVHESISKNVSDNTSKEKSTQPQRDPRSKLNSRSSCAKSNRNELIGKDDGHIIAINSHSDEFFNKNNLEVTESSNIQKSEQKLHLEIVNKEEQFETTKCSSNDNVTRSLPEKEVNHETAPHLKSDYKIPKNKRSEAVESDEKIMLESNMGSNEHYYQNHNILGMEKSVACNNDSNANAKHAYNAPIGKPRRNSEYIPRRPPRTPPGSPSRTPPGSPPRHSVQQSPKRTQSGDRSGRFNEYRKFSQHNVHNYKESTWNQISNKRNDKDYFINEHKREAACRGRYERKYRYGSSNTFHSRRVDRSRSQGRYEGPSKYDRRGGFNEIRPARSRSKFRNSDDRDIDLSYRFQYRERYENNFPSRYRRRIDQNGGAQLKMRFSRSSSSEPGSVRGAAPENIETYREWRTRNKECNPNELKNVHQDVTKTKSDFAPNLEQNVQTLRHAQQMNCTQKKTLRRECETDYSDLDDIRLHLSPSSDETVVYDNDHLEQGSFDLDDDFEANIKLMDVEELERTVKKKQKELEDIQQKDSEAHNMDSRDTEVSKRPEKNVKNMQSKSKIKQTASKKEQITTISPSNNSSIETEDVPRNELVPDKELKQHGQGNDPSEQLALKSKVDEACERTKHLKNSKSLKVKKSKKSLERSRKSKTDIDTSGQLNNEASDKLSNASLPDENKSRCKVKAENSYDSLIVKVQEINKSAINYRLNHGEKLNVRESVDKQKEWGSAVTANTEDILPVKVGDTERVSTSSQVEDNVSNEENVRSEVKKKIDLSTYKKRNGTKSEANQDVALHNTHLSTDKPNSNTDEGRNFNDSTETVQYTGTDDEPINEPSNAHTANLISDMNENKDCEPYANVESHPNCKVADKTGTPGNDLKVSDKPQSFPEETMKDPDTNSDRYSPIVDVTSNSKDDNALLLKDIQDESKDMGSFIHDFSLSDDEISFSKMKSLRHDAVERCEDKHENKINILDISVVRPAGGTTFKAISKKIEAHTNLEPVRQDFVASDVENCGISDVQPECIETIHEAIQNVGFYLEQTPSEGAKEENSNKLDAEQLQRCLEDDIPSKVNVETKEMKTKTGQSDTNSSFGISNIANQSLRHNDSNTKPNIEIKICTPSPPSRKKRVDEQMRLLFGSDSKSKPDSVMKRTDAVKKNLAKTAAVISPKTQENRQIDQSTTPKPRASSSKTGDEILCSMLQKQEEMKRNFGHSLGVSKMLDFKERCYPVFCNNPNYIPIPQDTDFCVKLAEHIEKQEEIKLQVCKDLDKKNRSKKTPKKEQEVTELPGTKKGRKSKTNPIKIKMAFNSPSRKRKVFDNAANENQKKKRKTKGSITFCSDSSDDSENTESKSGKDSLRKKPKLLVKQSKSDLNNKQKSKNVVNKTIDERNLTNVSDNSEMQVNNSSENQRKEVHSCESETISKHKETVPSFRKKNKKKLSNTSDTVLHHIDKSCTETISVSERWASNNKQDISQLNEESNKAVFRKNTPRRITPVKIGEASLSNKRKLSNSTENNVPEELLKNSKTVQQIKANQSPLIHMEEMLKHYVKKSSSDIQETLMTSSSHCVEAVYNTVNCTNISFKGTSHVYTNAPLLTRSDANVQNTTANYPEVNQINLDSKDISLLGTVERGILDNMTAYFADKSLPTFESEDNIKSDKTAVLDSINKDTKEFTSPLNFSNMLNKNVNTSTPVKRENPTKAQASSNLPAQTEFQNAEPENNQGGLPKSSAASDVVGTSISTKTYIISPLKRERRRRAKIVTGIV